MISQGLHSLQSFVERNTTLVIQKAIALQIVGAGMTAEMDITTESCKLASKATWILSESDPYVGSRYLR